MQDDTVQTPPEDAHLDPDAAAQACATWVSAVEECFVAIRGRGVIWSPADSERATRWYRAGVPLGVAIRVLLARVRAWRFRHGEEARLPMHLGWYEPAILQATRTTGLSWALATAVLSQTPDPADGRAPGGAAPLAAAGSVADLSVCIDARLAELTDAIPGLIAANPSLVAHYVYRKAFEWLDAAQRPAATGHGDDSDTAMDAADLEDPAALVERCRASLCKLAIKGLDDAQSAALQAWVGAQAKPGLSKAARAARTRALQEQWLSGHLALHFPTLDGWELVDHSAG